MRLIYFHTLKAKTGYLFLKLFWRRLLHSTRLTRKPTPLRPKESILPLRFIILKIFFHPKSLLNRIQLNRNVKFQINYVYILKLIIFVRYPKISLDNNMFKVNKNIFLTLKLFCFLFFRRL